jgi:Protein of unknown function DUF72
LKRRNFFRISIARVYHRRSRCRISGHDGTSPRHFGPCGFWVARFVLPGRHEVRRPPNLLPDEIRHCGSGFDIYRAPSVATVSGWERKTPPGFKLSAKVPQIITHEKVLQNCDHDLKQFLDTMDLMGEKLGPLLFQFGRFSSTVFRSGKEFLARLAPSLSKLPKDHHFALEIRNKWWLDADFFDWLRVHIRWLGEG